MIHYRTLYLGLIIATSLLSLSASATPQTNMVTSLGDHDAGSLRQTIANSQNGDIIQFATNGTIVLTSGELVITNDLTIIGPDVTNLVISGNNSNRVFNINSNVTISLSDLTIRDGNAPTGSYKGLSGGGILNQGTLFLSNCTITHNRTSDGGNTDADGSHGGDGGGVYNSGTLSAERCSFSHNNADSGRSGSRGGIGWGYSGGNGGHGGGIYNAGALNLTDCLFNENAAGSGGTGGMENGRGGNGGNGGGIYNASQAILENCTFCENRSGYKGLGGDGDNGNDSLGSNMGPEGNTGHGGAIYNAGNTLSLTSCTLSQNITSGFGSGIYNASSMTAATVRNCLIADNTLTPSLLEGGFSTQGHNLIGNGSGSSGFTHGLNNDLVGNATNQIYANLTALADHGGPTFTMALLPNSPAIDQGDDTLSGTDQRGEMRRFGWHVDIGAYEADIWHVTLFTSNGPSAHLTSVQYPNSSNTVISAVSEQSHWTFTGWSDGNTNQTRTLQAPLSSQTYTALFTESPAPLFLYVATNGNNTASGLSWDTPLETIQVAIDCTFDGDTVLVSNGVYNTGAYLSLGSEVYNRVIITNNITVQSAHGPHVTSIVGEQNNDKNVRGLFINQGQMVGFSLTNGSAPQGGGAYAVGGSLSNCILSANSGVNGGGAYGGILNNCTLKDNRADHGAGSHDSILNNCLLTGNIAKNGGGAFGSTLNNCVLSNNLARVYATWWNTYDDGVGGGAKDCALTNCLITANTAWEAGATSGGSLSLCTVTKNTTDYTSAVTDGTLSNCIVWDNQKYASNQLANHDDCVINDSCTSPLPAGIGNISEDPQFVNITNQNFRLKLTSPCINAGNGTVTTAMTDLEGKTRIVGTVDMGAYEFQPSPGYETWALQRPAGLVAPDQLDKNGHPNLLKYATGSSPIFSDERARLNAVVTNDHLAIRFNRNTAATDVTMIVEGNNDLTNPSWVGIATNANGTGWNSAFVIESGSTSPVSVKIQDPTGTNHFLRLRVIK